MRRNVKSILKKIKIIFKSFKLIISLGVLISFCLYGKTVDNSVVKGLTIPPGNFLGLKYGGYTQIQTNMITGISIGGGYAHDIGTSLAADSLSKQLSSSGINTQIKGGQGGQFRVGYYWQRSGYYQYADKNESYKFLFEVGFEYQYNTVSFGDSNFNLNKYALYWNRVQEYLYVDLLLGVQSFPIKALFDYLIKQSNSSSSVTFSADNINVPFLGYGLGLNLAINETISITAGIELGAGIMSLQIDSTRSTSLVYMIDFNLGIKAYL